MIKFLLSASISIGLLSGCESAAVSYEGTVPDLSAEASQFLGKAQSAIAAYQNGDKTTWERLVCQSPSKKSLEHVQKFIGTYENVRLIAVKDRWSAANKPPYQGSIEVAFEGAASKYPLPNHAMAVTFTDIGRGCLYLSI